MGEVDELVKSLILLAPQAILGFMTRLAKLQELGLTPSNSLQFLTPDAFSKIARCRLQKTFYEAFKVIARFKYYEGFGVKGYFFSGHIDPAKAVCPNSTIGQHG